jgi:hypothetical protein
MGLREAEEKVERGLKDEIPWKSGVYGDGTARWKDSLEMIEMVHGKAERRKVEALLSRKPKVAPKRKAKPKAAPKRKKARR